MISFVCLVCRLDEVYDDCLVLGDEGTKLGTNRYQYHYH